MRLPILYSEVQQLDESAVTVLFDKVKNTQKTCVMNDYERRYPTYCGDVAHVIRHLSQKRLEASTCSTSFTFCVTNKRATYK